MSKLSALKKISSSQIAVAVMFTVVIGSLILLVYFWQDINWLLLRQISLNTLIWLLLLSVLGSLVYALAIYLLVRSSGYHTTLWQSFLVLNASLSANYVTPVKAGIPLRIYLYNHFMLIPPGIGTGLIAVETLVGMFTPAIIATIGITFLFNTISIYIPLTFLVILVVIAGAIMFVPVGWLSSGLNWLPKPHLTKRGVNFLLQVQNGLQAVPFVVILALMFLFTLGFAIHAIRLYLILQAINYPVSITALFYALTISVTVGNISMLPMGLGVRDASLTWLLIQMGIPNEVALSMAVIQRVFSPGWPLLLGIISGNILGISELLKKAEGNSPIS